MLHLNQFHPSNILLLLLLTTPSTPFCRQHSSSSSWIHQHYYFWTSSSSSFTFLSLPHREASASWSGKKTIRNAKEGLRRMDGWNLFFWLQKTKPFCMSCMSSNPHRHYGMSHRNVTAHMLICKPWNNTHMHITCIHPPLINQWLSCKHHECMHGSPNPNSRTKQTKNAERKTWNPCTHTETHRELPAQSIHSRLTEFSHLGSVKKLLVKEQTIH